MYEVSYSRRVTEAVRELVARNPAHARSILSSVRQIHDRFRVYPQFGQPLRDLEPPGAQLWIAVVAPLVVLYVLIETDTTRHVTVVRPFFCLPNSGLS